VSGLQAVLIVAIALPALAIALWPLLRWAPGDCALAVPDRADHDRRLELGEEKTALYRALRELEFDHEAGHLSDADYQSLRERYETRAAALITELDALGGAVERERPEAVPAPAAPPPASPRVPWTRR